MPPELAVQPVPRSADTAPPALHVVPERALRIVDVALWYGERSGGIRTYLDAKVAFAREHDGVDHHLVVPGPSERHVDGRHELPGVRMSTPNGYRLPLGASALTRTLRELSPDVVLLHDLFWAPARVSSAARAAGALVVAVHHGSSELDAAGIPGPSRVYVPVFRAWLRRAARHVDVLMSVVDTTEDCGRPPDLPLRLGLEPVFRPQHGVVRGNHTLYVGRLAREKGVFELLAAAARSGERWPLCFVGAGPALGALRDRARRLGLEDRVHFAPHVADRTALARCYAHARCVVMPGRHETFGLVAAEAAASGARVVCCTSAPSGRLLGGLAHTFAPGDVDGLAAAITAARAARPDPAAAAALARRLAWSRVLQAELDDLRDAVADR